jgi:hypothetical protein
VVVSTNYQCCRTARADDIDRFVTVCLLSIRMKVGFMFVPKSLMANRSGGIWEMSFNISSQELYAIYYKFESIDRVF